jgi:predicted dehydrogenase
MDALMVVGPPQVNVSVAREALSRDIHVFAEKPPAVTTEELQQLADLAHAKQRTTIVGHNLRYAEACTTLRELLGTEQILNLEVRYMASGPCGDRWALGSPVRSMLLSHGIHVVDLVLWMMGRPVNVRASVARGTRGGMVISAHIGFEGDRLASIVFGNVAPTFFIDVWATTHGGTTAHMDSLRQVSYVGGSLRGKRWSEVWRPRTLAAGHLSAGYAGVVEAFFQAVRGANRAVPSFSDELATYAVIDEIERGIGPELIS